MPPRWHIKRYLSWMSALGYVSQINLTSAVGYVSHTYQITAMRYACTNFLCNIPSLTTHMPSAQGLYEIITRTFVLEGLVFC